MLARERLLTKLAQSVERRTIVVLEAAGACKLSICFDHQLVGPFKNTSPFKQFPNYLQGSRL